VPADALAAFAAFVLAASLSHALAAFAPAPALAAPC